MMTLAAWKLDENKLIESHFDDMQVFGIENRVATTVTCYTHIIDHGHYRERVRGKRGGRIKKKLIVKGAIFMNFKSGMRFALVLK